MGQAFRHIPDALGAHRHRSPRPPPSRRRPPCRAAAELLPKHDLLLAGWEARTRRRSAGRCRARPDRSVFRGLRTRRHVPGNIFKHKVGPNIDMTTNELVIRIQPRESIYLKINNKVRAPCKCVHMLSTPHEPLVPREPLNCLRPAARGPSAVRTIPPGVD